MTLQVDILNPIDYPEWDDLLLSSQEYSFFHSSPWARVLIESYHYKPQYITLIDGSTLLALVPLMEIRSFLTGNRGVSLPFSDYCDPIVSKDISFQDILFMLMDYGKKAGWNYFEIRGGDDFLEDTPSSSFSYGHTIDLLQDETAIFSKFRNSTKRNIKKATREGVKVSINNSSESVREFYRLNCITRKMHGLPPQPFIFFRKIFEHIIAKNFGFVTLATFKEETIAGAIYFHIGQKAIYKYGASDRKFQHLRANNLVMWEAIRWCLQNEITFFCFGRTEPENKGLRQFKNGWGGKERVIKYHRYDLQKDSFIENIPNVPGLLSKIFSIMPIPVARLAGNILYKHVG